MEKMVSVMTEIVNGDFYESCLPVGGISTNLPKNRQLSSDSKRRNFGFFMAKKVVVGGEFHHQLASLTLNYIISIYCSSIEQETMKIKKRNFLREQIN